jgi:hypothetical protein
MSRRKRDGGDCYQAAATLVLDGFVPEGSTVCHALVRPWVGRLAGHTFGHAWVETPDGTVTDQSNGLNVVGMDRDGYYAIGSINSDEVRRYSLDDVRSEIVRTGHWGPWDEALFNHNPEEVQA